MNNSSDKSPNLAYQTVCGSSGGSYNDDKLRVLQMPDLRGKRFLDLGCNAGFYCGIAHDQGAEHVLGVDLDPAVIKLAREQHPEVDFIDTGWDQFPDGEFDVVICLSAIHYAKDPIKLVENIHSRLRPGGVFILECGLVDSDATLFTDTLMPVWREVGDRCRHLSGGYIANHLLRNFNWHTVGSSEPRGGDPVSRFVIHASSHGEHVESDVYRIDLVEYAKCLVLSSETISSARPSYSLVSRLAQCDDITTSTLEEILSNDDNFEVFLDNIVFTLGWRRPMKVELSPTTDSPIRGRVQTSLRKKNIDV